MKKKQSTKNKQIAKSKQVTKKKITQKKKVAKKTKQITNRIDHVAWMVRPFAYYLTALSGDS